MTPHPPSTQQYTIRIFPWFIVLLTVFICGSFGWALLKAGISYIAILAILIMLAVIAIFAEVITCKMDRQTQTVTIKQSRIWRTKRHQLNFTDIHTISVDMSSDTDGGNIYRVLFVLHNGDSVPLANISSSGKRSKARLAQKIAAYINQSGSVRVQTALDGIVRIRHDGETNGVHWQMTFVKNNDNVPHTIWETRAMAFFPGFLFIVPSTGKFIGALPDGLAGKWIQKLYQRYNLGVLDIKPNDLPDFKDAQVLPSDAAGLNGFMLVTTSPGLARSWLSPHRISQLTAWQASNTLSSNQAASAPHILVSTQGFRIAFRGNFNQMHEVNQIASLGAGLSRN
jgi:hypothetical protein